MNRRLFRSRTDSVIGGVAGGVAEYLDVDPSIVRIVWAVLAIVTGGVFFVLYIVMWIVVPQTPLGPAGPYQPMPGAVPGWAPPGVEPSVEPGAATAPPAEGAAMPAAGTTEGTAWTGYPAATGYEAHPRRRGSNGAMIFGIILVGLGVWFLLDQFVPGLNTDLLWPIGLVVLGVALLFVSMRRSSES